MSAFDVESTGRLGVRQSAGARLPAGLIIDDRYEVLEFAGSGGMCDVYMARHIQLNKTIALKLLQKRRLSDEKSMERFRREAVFISNLEHPNIVKVFGFGLWERQLYLAMEYVQGISLQQLLKTETRLSRTRALAIFDQILQALQHAHDRGIIHRDLKPSNVMLLEGDRVKLVDFGIAKMLPDGGKEIQKLTQTEDIFGTLLYMSPEQCLGRPVDARSDIYSMGCLMYETLTGGPPLNADTPFGLIHKQLTEPTPTSAWLDQSLTRPVMQCLEKDPQKRPQSAADLRELLSKCGKQEPRQSARTRAVCSKSNTPVLGRRRRVLVPICVGASIAFAIAIFYMFRAMAPAATKTSEVISQTMPIGPRISVRAERADEALAKGNTARAEQEYKAIIQDTDPRNFTDRVACLMRLIGMALRTADKSKLQSYREQLYVQIQTYARGSRPWQSLANHEMIEAAQGRGDLINAVTWANRQCALLDSHVHDSDFSEDERIRLSAAWGVKALAAEHEGALKSAEGSLRAAEAVLGDTSRLSHRAMGRYFGVQDALIKFLIRHGRVADARAVIAADLPARRSWQPPDPIVVAEWADEFRQVKDRRMALNSISTAIAALDGIPDAKGYDAYRAQWLIFRAEEYASAGDMTHAYADRVEAQAITDRLSAHTPSSPQGI
ncbi:MAG TPA: serine/threonine-protein kinase [Candidatus Obscuribacterales bacterium]